MSTRRVNCAICGDQRLKDVIDLGEHPCADYFVNVKDLQTSDPTWRLIVTRCDACGHAQTKNIVSRVTRYEENEYSFVSSHSISNRNYWDRLALETVTSDERVLEFGCNDGYFLEACRKKGCVVRGVDPSSVMVDLARSRGIDVTCGYFEDIVLERETYDIVFASNVLNHVDDLSRCFEQTRSILKDGGRFVVQVPDWRWMIDTAALDQIYHEHVHYFTADSLRLLARSHGFVVSSHQEVDFHGRSLLMCFVVDDVRHERDLTSTRSITEGEMIESLERFTQKTREINEIVTRAHVENRDVFALGASAKGNTLLNCADLTWENMTAVLDISDRKVGKYTPKTRIPILNEAVIASTYRPLIITTTPNLPNSVHINLRKLNAQVEII